MHNGMENITLVDNLHHDEDGLFALDEDGNRTKVFVRQGSLDCCCVIYSLVMQMILQKWFTYDELVSREKCMRDELVDMFKAKYLYKLKGRCKGGFNFRTVAKNLRNMGKDQLRIEDFTTFDGKDKVTKPQLLDIITQRLGEGIPVMTMYYSITRQYAHAVLAFGLMKTASQTRLLCLDSASSLRLCDMWNCLIDTNPNGMNRLVFDDDLVIINGALIVNSGGCPF